MVAARIGDRHAHRHPAHADGGSQRVIVHARQPHHAGIAPFLGAAGKHHRCEHGPDQHREDQRAQQRERYRPRHRLEQAAFHRLQGEDGQVRRDDNGDGIEHRPLHFVRRPLNFLGHAFAGMRFAVRQQAHDVLDHHHRAFHDHAEIERAERQQIRRNSADLQANGGEQECERNGQRDDERAADVAEEDQQNHRYQNDSLGQIVQHRVGGEVHQIAAVEEWDDGDARREHAMV